MLIRLTALLACAGDGAPLPMFLIIKCTSTGPDLSGTRVVQALQGEEPFKGWHLHMWSKVLDLDSVKGGPKKYVRVQC
jgi:hypothetical protein